MCNEKKRLYSRNDYGEGHTLLHNICMQMVIEIYVIKSTILFEEIFHTGIKVSMFHICHIIILYRTHNTSLLLRNTGLILYTYSLYIIYFFSKTRPTTFNK